MPSQLNDRIQSKIVAYNSLAATRYPPSIAYYKLSEGYQTSGEADADGTPTYALFTGNNSAPDTTGGGNLIFLDQVKNLTYNGEVMRNSNWYKAFDSNGDRTGLIVQIDSSGNVIDKVNSKVP